MGNIILVWGPSGSGKSAYAEELSGILGGDKYYIATMRPVTEENFSRIKRHRRRREGLGFRTLELPDRVADAPVTPDSTVLLEDVSNLLANAMFEDGKTDFNVLEDILALSKRCKTLIAVTISGLRPTGDSAETDSYIYGLNDLNSSLSLLSTVLIEMREGRPVYLKGDLDDIS